MKNKWFTWTVGVLLVAGLALIGVLVVSGRGLWGLEGAQPARRVGSSMTLVQAGVQAAQIQPAQNPAQNAANQFVGAYSGVVKLNTTVIGVYSDTLTIPPPPGAGTPTPPDLGSIDLSLMLNQTDNTLSGYVSLDKTLVYSVEHTIGSGAAAVKIGPYLSGAVNGSTLNVASERLSLTVGGRAVQRQFRLMTTSVTNDGAELNGEYRETLWGYTSAPITVIGAFTLQRAGANAITPVLAPTDPTVLADTATTTQGTAVTIPVLGNDRAANGGTLTITAVGKPQFGTATTDGQTVTYTPNATFVGTDSFSYFVSDGKGGAAAGSVTVLVNGPNGPNQAPTAADDNMGTTLDTAVTINVLGNDSDPNGDALLITIDSQPAHGTAMVQNGQIVYTPQTGYTGTDSFTYIISDGKGGTATATVTVTITGQPSVNVLYLPLIRR